MILEEKIQKNIIDKDENLFEIESVKVIALGEVESGISMVCGNENQQFELVFTTKNLEMLLEFSKQ